MENCKSGLNWTDVCYESYEVIFNGINWMEVV